VGMMPEGQPANKGSRLASAWRPATRGSEWTGATTVPLSEGNEARREGRWGIGALS